MSAINGDIKNNSSIIPMIDILMATYNGERFVAEQIDSILAQTYTDWCLICHDDGSTDRTVDIIRQYAARDQRILLIEDTHQLHDVALNFIHLLSYSNSDFVMFCDQDDIWLPDKVEQMYKTIAMRDQAVPQVVYSNAYLWSAEQGIIANRNTLTYPTTLRQLLFLNTGIQGAASIFNASMRQIMQKHLDFYAMHDHPLLLAGITMGQVTYIDKPLMYYRQHADNVTGNAPGSKLKKLFLMWENRHVPIVSNDHLKGLKAFYKEWKENLKEDDKYIIELFCSLPELSPIRRAVVIASNGFKLFDSTTLLMIKLCLRKYIASNNS